MSRYSVELTSLARRQLKKLPAFAQKQVGKLIDLSPRTRDHAATSDFTGNSRIIVELIQVIIE